MCVNTCSQHVYSTCERRITFESSGSWRARIGAREALSIYIHIDVNLKCKGQCRLAVTRRASTPIYACVHTGRQALSLVYFTFNIHTCKTCDVRYLG